MLIKTYDINHDEVFLKLNPAQAIDLLCKTLNIDLVNLHTKGKIYAAQNSDGEESIWHVDVNGKLDMYDDRADLYDLIEELCCYIMEHYNECNPIIAGEVG